MGAMNAFEAEILLWLGGVLSNPVFDLIMRVLSWLGDSGRVFIVLALVLLCIKRTRVYGVILATALLIDLLVVNVTIKPLIARARPYDFSDLIHIIITPPSGLSFPSGHTAVSFAAAGALSVCGRRVHTAALVFASLMGLSRLYLMVHYPTDVLAGAVVGSLCGWAAVGMWKAANTKKSEETD